MFERSSAYFVALLVCVWTPENFHAREHEETRFDVLKSLLFSGGPEENERFGLDTPTFQYSSESTADEETKEEEDRRVRLEDHRVLCEVVKKRMEFKISGMTHKPDSLTFYACKESNVSRHSMVQELIDFGSDRGDKEFCWISRERSPPKCETKHQQVAVFSREFGSSLWSYRNVHVPAGCGCHLGMKHFN